MLRTLALAILTLAAMAGPAASEGGAGFLAWIEVETDDGTVTLTGNVSALETGVASAALRICRESGSGNRAETRQSRTLRLAAGETGVVARTGFDVAPQDRLVAMLTVTVEGVRVSETRLIHGPAPSNALDEDDPCR